MNPNDRIRKNHNPVVKGRWMVNIGNLENLGLKELSNQFFNVTRLDAKDIGSDPLDLGDFFDKYDNKGIDNDKKSDS